MGASESCCGQGPFLFWVPPLWTAKALTYKGVEGSRVHALGTALTKKGPKIENGRMKVNGNKTITLENLRTARKRTSKPVLKLQKCDVGTPQIPSGSPLYWTLLFPNYKKARDLQHYFY